MRTVVAILLFSACASAQKGVGEGSIAKVPVREKGYEGMVYHLFTPKKLAKDKRYPLVYALHGNGDTSANHAKSLSRLSTREAPVFVVAPGYQQEPKYNAPVIQGAGFAFERILEEVLRKHPVDPGRVVLQGFSMGASYATTWLNAFRNSNANAARPLPFRLVLLNSGLVAPRPPLLGVPIRVFVGAEERDVRGRNVLESVRTVYLTMFRQGTDVAYLEMPKMGHTIDDACIARMRAAIAALPDFGGILPADVARELREASDALHRGDFAKALAVLDRSGHKKAKKSHRAVIAWIRKQVSAAARNRKPTLQDVVFFEAIHSGLGEDHPKLQKSVFAAIEKLAKKPTCARDVAARAAFRAARMEPKQTTEKMRALASGPHGRTVFGRRAAGHLQATRPLK